jgi:hypothetical protein
MKIHLINTPVGLVPLYETDYDAKKKLKQGEIYEVSIKRARNYAFLKKYFALINCAFEYLNEAQTNFFKTNENFRKTVQIAAGHYDMIFLLSIREWVQSPKSIAFDKLSESEFSDLYDRVKDVIFSVFLKNIEWDEFEKNLINF